MRLARLEPHRLRGPGCPRPRRRSCWTRRPSALPLEGVIDFAAEQGAAEQGAREDREGHGGDPGRLDNPGFVAKAPEEVLEEARERKATLLARRAKIEEALARLSQTG